MPLGHKCMDGNDFFKKRLIIEGISHRFFGAAYWFVRVTWAGCVDEELCEKEWSNDKEVCVSCFTPEKVLIAESLHLL